MVASLIKRAKATSLRSLFQKNEMNFQSIRFNIHQFSTQPALRSEGSELIFGGRSFDSLLSSIKETMEEKKKKSSSFEKRDKRRVQLKEKSPLRTPRNRTQIIDARSTRKDTENESLRKNNFKRRTQFAFTGRATKSNAGVMDVQSPSTMSTSKNNVRNAERPASKKPVFGSKKYFDVINDSNVENKEETKDRNLDRALSKFTQSREKNEQNLSSKASVLRNKKSILLKKRNQDETQLTTEEDFSANNDSTAKIETSIHDHRDISRITPFELPFVNPKLFASFTPMSVALPAGRLLLIKQLQEKSTQSSSMTGLK
ncbi:hypothetical protein POMI540_1450 [Schizosaccharomyces pombe]|uniref:Uncharacterized protein P4H10.18c n=1 Tax=Schizosaccharomyces pombe (strain 972 / ATCC 24843) TaxID=284812 RepID=YOFI_SCHPO|nr:uncharacterized protein SPBP4H10.18c [Schizosaccharomyces pombe]Q9P7D1.1 RecName: Full=Uncharacterized protein P4H10.18c [Schizosaccharomyces pombe 972h-]CAB83176.1 sequence orphan [Schizosaccharomyces pombe]|eukprot:NP_596192.1 uncharacterized protein SPBP4H10.18c [Schizosaccharomyces pombe]